MYRYRAGEEPLGSSTVFHSQIVSQWVGRPFPVSSEAPVTPDQMWE